MASKAAAIAVAMTAWVGVLCLGVGSCAPSPADDGEGRAATTPARGTPAIPSLVDPAPREYPGIHNAVAFHEGLVSGSAPGGDAGLETLAALGVRTIISVDGATPDVAGARARGMRYIHLPLGYDGVDEHRTRQLARAARDAIRLGPVYVHCHHGKHRSAGAAAVIAASLGWCSGDEGVARMRVAGTSEAYAGLFADARAARPIDPRELDAVPDDFPSACTPSGLVQGMLEIDGAYERLTDIRRAGWKTPADQPDLVPAGCPSGGGAAGGLVPRSVGPRGGHRQGVGVRGSHACRWRVGTRARRGPGGGEARGGGPGSTTRRGRGVVPGVPRTTPRLSADPASASGRGPRVTRANPWPSAAAGRTPRSRS
jgi:protein tyrosine phosphatase (PTP) superfamily phosphohydrolase (DUF442 family)